MNFFPSCLKQMPLTMLMLIGCMLFSSCGDSMIAATAAKPYKALTHLIPRRVPIAEVRTKDLRKMPTGAERAQAWSSHLDSKRYAYTTTWSPPKDYQAPTLPDTRGLPTTGGILPPLQPGQDTSLEGRGNLPSD